MSARRTRGPAGTVSVSVLAGSNVASLNVGRLPWPQVPAAVRFALGDGDLVLTPAEPGEPGARRLSANGIAPVTWPDAGQRLAAVACPAVLDAAGRLHVTLPPPLADLGPRGAGCRLRLPVRKLRRAKVAQDECVGTGVDTRQSAGPLTQVGTATPSDPEHRAARWQRCKAVGSERVGPPAQPARALTPGTVPPSATLPAPPRRADPERAAIDAAVAAGKVTRIPERALFCRFALRPGVRCKAPPAAGSDYCAEHAGAASWRGRGKLKLRRSK